MLKHLTVATLCSLLAAPLFADTHHPMRHATSGVQAAHAWARALPATAKTGAVYMHLHNLNHQPDSLVSAESNVAEKIELHTVEHIDDVMKMVHIPSITVGAQEHLVLAPGGKLLMLFGLKQPLIAGATFPITLTFDKAGQLDVTVKVVNQPTDTEHTHHH